MSDWTTLVTAGELLAALGDDDLVVIDARASLGDRSAARAGYLEAHVPGARFADLEEDLARHGPDGGRHPWPDEAQFAAALSRWGVRPGDRVVAYDTAGGALAAARLWFMLQAFGHRQAAVLDGGWAAWCAAGGAVESGEVAVAPSIYPTGRFERDRLLDAVQVEAHLAAGGVLVDARAPERFRGEVEPIDRIAGHVPGAVNRPFAENLVDGRFKPSVQLASEFGGLLGNARAGDVVVMCGSGVTACHHLLAMAHAGMPGARLFTGSWSGWIEDPARPVARG